MGVGECLERGASVHTEEWKCPRCRPQLGPATVSDLDVDEWKEFCMRR